MIHSPRFFHCGHPEPEEMAEHDQKEGSSQTILRQPTERDHFTRSGRIPPLPLPRVKRRRTPQNAGFSAVRVSEGHCGPPCRPPRKRSRRKHQRWSPPKKRRKKKLRPGVGVRLLSQDEKVTQSLEFCNSTLFDFSRSIVTFTNQKIK